MKKFKIILIVIAFIILITAVGGWGAVSEAVKEFLVFCLFVGGLFFIAVVLFVIYKIVEICVTKDDAKDE